MRIKAQFTAVVTFKFDQGVTVSEALNSITEEQPTQVEPAQMELGWLSEDHYVYSYPDDGIEELQKWHYGHDRGTGKHKWTQVGGL